MSVRVGALAAVAAAVVAGAVGTPMASAQEPVCPAGMYWNAALLECLPDYVHPVIGPAGPVGVGGVVGPVGPGPVGPGPVGPGPVGPGPLGPGPR
ncbi:hypothetical protein MPRF_32550 [Mycolicibacterium parafortuitum]|uniref:Uncharacterized protein n=1 Tax=Mycolicibacterium parafortuitum TaxID=39692 RepID=A0A7I7U7L5_MYCPF|nr:hypothetical protein [Mycolicibacterium parafortuitum]BBY76356.1 hypothetical protein MPRF_32550 [Mycolicibacterium parafortuitum]